MINSSLAIWRLAARLLWRELRAGEFVVVLLALALATFAIASTGILAMRVERAILLDASQLLGADVALRSDHAIAPKFITAAQRPGLQSAQSIELPTSIKIANADRFQLVQLRALSDAFPLRGQLLIEQKQLANYQIQPAHARALPPGSAWLAKRLQSQLGVELGASIKIGAANFVVAGWITQEPDASLDYFGIAPSVMIGMADLNQTSLLQPGTRAVWRLLVAEQSANKTALRAFSNEIRPILERGQRLQTVQSARSEVRVGYQRGVAFLRLSLLVSLLLAGAAIVLGARRYQQQQLDSFAILRALGVRKNALTILLLGKLCMLAAGAALFGLSLAALSDQLLSLVLDRYWQIQLPTANWQPYLQSLVAAFALLLAFVWPSFWQLRATSAMRVLQRNAEPEQTRFSRYLAIGLPVIIMSLLTIWLAQSLRIGLLVLTGTLIALLFYALIARLLLWLAALIRARTSGMLRFGVAALLRRPAASVLQILALASGVSALLTLAMLRSDLLSQWQADLPPDTPNRFVINVQDQQLPAVRALLKQATGQEVKLWPMIRGRLVAVNDQAVDYKQYQGRRAKRLAEREFNLSISDQLPNNNQLVAGLWWPSSSTQAEFSAEEGIAKLLNWQLGDRIQFDIGGVPVVAKLTSLRKVKWESFEPNFFVLMNPAALAEHKASWIASFHAPNSVPFGAGSASLDADLVSQFPNVSVINLQAIIERVQEIVRQVTRAIELMFWFTVLAGLLVLYAAIQATQDERRQEAAVLRVFGASAKQLNTAHGAEFVLLGACAGLLAAISATAMTAAIAYFIFDFSFVPNFGLVVGGVLGTMLLITLLAWLGTRQIRQVAPTQILRM